MKFNFFRIIFTSVILLIILIFFLSLNISNQYDTSRLAGNKISSFEIKEFFNDKLVTEKELTKNDYNLINFWPSWCAPCREEHNILLDLKNTNKIEMFGVNYKDKKINAKKFLAELGNPYDVTLEDRDGKQSINFGIYGVPESILIDKNLIIVKKFIGPLKTDDYTKILEIIKK